MIDKWLRAVLLVSKLILKTVIKVERLGLTEYRILVTLCQQSTANKTDDDNVEVKKIGTL